MSRAYGAGMTFTGFPDSAWDLLSQAGHRDLTWYRRNRQALREELIAPARALVSDLGPPLLASVSPSLVIDPRVNGSLAPLVNDARFAHLPPLKGYLDLRFAEAGPERSAAPVLLLRLAPGRLRIGAAVRLQGARLAAYRDAVAGAPGADLVEILARLRRRPHFECRPPELARTPSGYDADDPIGDLLRRRSLQVWWTEPTPKVVATSRFVGWCARRLAGLGDLHRWTTRHTAEVSGGRAPRPTPP